MIFQSVKSIDHICLDGFIVSLVAVMASQSLSDSDVKSLLDKLLSLDAANKYQTINNWRHPKLKIGLLHLLCLPLDLVVPLPPSSITACPTERFEWLLPRLNGLESTEDDCSRCVCAGLLDVNVPSHIGTPYTLSRLVKPARRDISKILASVGADTDPARGVPPASEQITDNVILTKEMFHELDVMLGRHITTTAHVSPSAPEQGGFVSVLKTLFKWNN
jgi:hypothetical protein